MQKHLEVCGNKPNDILANSEWFKSKITITGKLLIMVMKKMLKQWFH